jgi:hypothetical protein
MPTSVSADVRYRLATIADEKSIIDQLRKAIDDGVIVEDPAVTIEMAARRLRALGSTQGVLPVCASGVGVALVTAYAAYKTVPPAADPDHDIAPFWNGVMANPALATAHLQLALCAVTLEADSRPLILDVQTEGFALTSVKNLDPTPWPGPPVPALDFGKWKQVFTHHPSDLPAITAPGTLDERISAFIRRLRKFFEVATTGIGPSFTLPDTPPVFARPPFDPIEAFYAAYIAQPGHAGYMWGQGLDTTVDAVLAVLPMDDRGREWLRQAVVAIDELTAITNIVLAPPLTPAFHFSLIEALFARGFTSAASVAALSASDFTDALLGTVAYPDAAAIYAKAGGAGGPIIISPGEFKPINSDGSLTNCLPPCELSPLGRIAYLHQLLVLSFDATCEDASRKGPSIGVLIQERRGNLGDLTVTCANAETPLPVVDLVNECLEAMVANGTASGVTYDTARDVVAGHHLRELDAAADPDAVPYEHDPQTLFGALAEHSMPATPVALPNAYTKLASDFSAPVLPYAQALDVNRSYLGALGTSRFSVMRCFRKDITEFVLDPTPADEPAGFPRQQWRYPVGIDIAREYLNISKEEYDLFFTTTPAGPMLPHLFGFLDSDLNWITKVRLVSEFLKRTGLTYCEFLDLWHSGFVKFHGKRLSPQSEDLPFPECEPCYIDKIVIVFDDPPEAEALVRLAVFIRLWRKLQHVANAKYTFTELKDICNVLGLFDGGGNVNPDFVRQLVAFQMLRDDFRLDLTDPIDPAAGTGASRTHILALWVSPPPAEFDWAVGHLIDRIERHARRKKHGHQREPEFLKLLATNLDPLSRLGGFDPAAADRRWQSAPSHTLRFAEVLSKIYNSHFGIGEILYLFTADPHLAGDDPFPLEDENEAIENPLEHPDDEEQFSLWQLRRKLLDVAPADDAAESWTWPRIVGTLREELGFPAPAGGVDPLYALGAHFFRGVLERYGMAVDSKDHRYAEPLAGSSALMWNTPESPFFYYDGPPASELRVEIPLRDEAVLMKLSRIRPLTAAEAQAVRDLYYRPRLELAQFAYLFPSLAAADVHLVQEPSEEKRWEYFRKSFARFYARCGVIAEHLAEHVQYVTDHRGEHVRRLAWKVLVNLLGDENRALVPPHWEQDSGERPDVTWKPVPAGGAFNALVGLIGTGLLGDYRTGDGKNLVWRELRGPTDAFDELRNAWNIPLPTILPALNFDLTDEQKRWAQVRNSVAIAAATAKRLGGCEPYRVKWQGVLLVEESGTYRFLAGGPTPAGENPDLEHVHGRSWRVSLKRGEKEWVLLSRGWPDEDDCAPSASLGLKRGAYDLTIEYERCGPTDDDLEDMHGQHTGFQLKYEGPDTENKLVTIPRMRLYIAEKNKRLSQDLSAAVNGVPKKLLDELYVSTLRDIRRTYQRAFKALLFAHRFHLSAEPFADYAQSEIGFMLDHAAQFAGISFFRNGIWKPHLANFDFNLLLLEDTYSPPPAAQDDRTAPSIKREQALFDIWERTFDYTVLRRRAHKAPEHPVWLLFDEAASNQPDNPAHLLRHLDVDLTHSDLVLRFFNGFTVSAADLVDERWAIRIFRADRCVRHFVSRFAFEDVRDGRPDFWAADNPGAPGGGNEDLTRIVQIGWIENGSPRRYEDMKRVDDGLRLRAREALLAYLCAMSRVAVPGGFATAPKQLSELLLIDVEAGICERASRIEEAITAVQTFVQRARLGLEVSWAPTSDFIALWEGRFATFRIWQACERRTLYLEDWIEWDELARARRSEAFRLLEDQLRRVTLAIPRPGALEYWDAGELPRHPCFEVLQQREPSGIRSLDGPREGLSLLGTPERSGQRSWLSPFPERTRPYPPGGNEPQGGVVILAHGNDTPPDHDELPTPINNLPPQATGRTTQNPTVPPSGKLPWWMEAAIRLGARFIRIAAACTPPASAMFQPRPLRGRDACCRMCGCIHEPIVDEYYFWLVDTRWFDVIEQDPDWPGWHDKTMLPKMLDWPSKSMMHLMWCHIHDGEIMQPRRSVEGVRLPNLTPPGTTELEYLGRTEDSLLFHVVGGVFPDGVIPPPSPGFRYDLTTDDAIVVPTPIAIPVPSLNPGGLSAYPFFAYFTPGAPLFPLTPFSEATCVAAALRAHCRYEPALKWYALAFDPQHDDNQWCPGAHQRPQPHGSLTTDAPTDGSDQPPQEVICCRHGDVPPEIAQRRDITLDYLETLLAWGDCLMQRNSPEAFQQARLIFDTASKILGPTPLTVQVDSPTDNGMKVSTFVADGAPLNPRLMSLYERIADRLSLIHACLNGRRLRNGRPRTDMPYFGDDPARNGWNTPRQSYCCEPDDCCCPGSPYRFQFLLQKANEFAGEVRSLGTALLAAFEKGDAEYLAYVRAGHEKQIASLMLSVRKNQWRDADWQVRALQKTKEIAQTNRLYYATLVSNGLIAGEIDYQSLVGSAIGEINAATTMEAIGTVLGVIPDIFVGTVDFTQLAVGTKLAQIFQGIARISMDVSQILNTTAGLRLTQAGWVRREDEWRHQIDIHELEIEQIERQILGAERRRDAALRELEVQQRQIENSGEVLDILRDKFTNHQLYLWLQRETAALYYQAFSLALCIARQAERAFNFERGYTTQKFVPNDAWDDLREGLLAGERLQLSLRRMEKAYLDANVREYELMRHISLRFCFAHSFLMLKLTGQCIVEIPEWFFDLDYPGHYMRRIKNVSLTIPCVVGPYTGVHCRLTLLSSATRVDPRLHDPIAPCCKEDPPKPAPPACGCWHAPRPHTKKAIPDASTNGYVSLRDDARIVRHYAATEAIATSGAQNDTGMFELNFRDERYLPFEFGGAVSRWRIELPPENNFFDLDSLSDVILHLNYTAREGGDVLRKAASEVAQANIPDDGRRVFDLKREMPDEWSKLMAECGRQRFHLRFSRDMFPYLPGDREVCIHRLELFVAAEGAASSTHREVEFVAAHQKGCPRGEEDEREFQCIGGAAWPGFFHGSVDVHVPSLRGNDTRHIGTFHFEERLEEISRAFLIVHYEVR